MAEMYLIGFKGSRKEYFYNKFYHSLAESDHVITQAERGEDIGIVLKRIDKKNDMSDIGHPGSILRKAGKEDISRHLSNQELDKKTRTEVIEMIRRHRLKMKVVDVETLLDGNKMTVYFTADHRVDFRELVKDLASRYKTRIELRQIGVRDEARRIGGVGICGLQQCCNSFIKEFKPISTQHAREQNLPMNPAKISGNCGRLLCCLRYEVETYRATKKNFPSPGSWVKTEAGEGVIERIDIFNEEAIIRMGDMVFSRAKASAITVLDRKGAGSELPGPDIVEQVESDTEQNREELKRLDDTRH